MPFYEKGDVRIHYEEVGSGFPLMVMPGGGLNSRWRNWPTPYQPYGRIQGRVPLIAADLRNANAGESAVRSRSTSLGTPSPTTSSG